MQSSKKTINELQTIIGKMPLNICCVAVLPEFGVQWREVSRAVRNARLPMTAPSIARVLCKHAAKSLPQEELDAILARLRLRLVATQSRTWHVIKLSEPTIEEPVSDTIRNLPGRVVQALRKSKTKNMRPQVETVLLDSMLYLSVQLVSESAQGSALFAATSPPARVVLVSSLGPARVLKAVVEGLGYSLYEDANLYGRDVDSLMRISDDAWNANAEHLTSLPEYNPRPMITENGIDYTNRNYDENYVDSILGPNPPLLTDLNIKTQRPFFDASRLNKTISLNVQLKSEDIAKTLKSWVTKGAIAPTSDFFQIFHQIKSNKITYQRDDSD